MNLGMPGTGSSDCSTWNRFWSRGWGNLTRLIRSLLGRYFFYMGNRDTRKAGGYVKGLGARPLSRCENSRRYKARASQCSISVWTRLQRLKSGCMPSDGLRGFGVGCRISPIHCFSVRLTRSRWAVVYSGCSSRLVPSAFGSLCVPTISCLPVCVVLGMCTRTTWRRRLSTGARNGPPTGARTTLSESLGYVETHSAGRLPKTMPGLAKAARIRKYYPDV